MKVIPNELSMLSNLAQGQQPSFELLFRAISIAVQSFQHIFIVIDALDECSDYHRLIATLLSMRNWDLDGLHLFLSSHQLIDFYEVFARAERSCNISIPDFSHDDIEEFVHRELSEQLHYLPESTRSVLKTRLATKAQGS